MKMHLLSFICSILMVLVSVGPETCNRPPEDGVECSFLVCAKDYTGTDGCGILLQLQDVTKLLATNLQQFAPTAGEGDTLRISYELAEDVVSICMAENKIVQLTCSELISKEQDCPDMVDPYRFAWSKRVMTELDPRQVESLIIGQQKGYRFVGAAQSSIYTCRGDLLCFYPNGDQEACKDILSKIRDPRIIYIVNE